MNDFPWTIFFVLLAAGVLGGVAILPYALALNPAVLEKLQAQQAARAKAIPAVWIVGVSGTLQSAVLIAIATFAGLLAAREVGLGLPILQGALQGQPILDKILAALPATLFTGVAVSLALYGLERYIFLPHLPPVFHEIKSRISFWKRALTPFYGGLNEEILLRLFVMSGLAWLIGLVWKSPEGTVTMGALWLANILAALLFGLGHLPATRGLTPLTPIVVTRGLILNGLGGLAFGFLYISYGLESAMLAHFCLDIMMHMIMPELTQSGG